jgi:acyl carrier protein
MNKLDEILCKIFRMDTNQLADNLTMEEVSGWDSLTHMDLISSLEEEFSVQLTMDEIMRMTDIKTIRTIILGYL